MPEKSIIQQLKDNEKPFGLMSEEMQAKMRDVDATAFQRFSARDNGTWCDHDMTDRVFLYDVPYRLRPDYEDEPEIVECEIYQQSNDVYYNYHGMCHLNGAFGDPDFIGFKYENGQVEFSPIVFKSDCSTKSICQFRDLADVAVLHATHVLFRRKKKE